MKPIPKHAACTNHPEKPAVARFVWREGEDLKEQRVCMGCGDDWWRKHEFTPMGKSLTIFEITRRDFEGEESNE